MRDNINWSEQFDYNNAQVQYEAIHQYMSLVNWKWFMYPGYKVPTVSEIKDKVYDLFWLAVAYYNSNPKNISVVRQGGFVVSIIRWTESVYPAINIEFNISSRKEGVIDTVTDKVAKALTNENVS